MAEGVVSEDGMCLWGYVSKGQCGSSADQRSCLIVLSVYIDAEKHVEVDGNGTEEKDEQEQAQSDPRRHCSCSYS